MKERPDPARRLGIYAELRERLKGKDVVVPVKRFGPRRAQRPSVERGDLRRD